MPQKSPIVRDGSGAALEEKKRGQTALIESAIGLPIKRWSTVRSPGAGVEADAP